MGKGMKRQKKSGRMLCTRMMNVRIVVYCALT